MSWDHELKKTICPCGNGTIEKDVKSDDWGRYEEGDPYINCPNCSKKYNLITVAHHSIYKWKGGSNSYYLVEKNVDLHVKREQKYPIVNEYELCTKDFPHYLIVAYKLEWLHDAKKELDEKTSINSLSGFASGIARCKKKHYGGVKIKELRKDLTIAIDEYNSYIVNKEKIEEQEALDKKAREEWLKRVEENGISINF